MFDDTEIDLSGSLHSPSRETTKANPESLSILYYTTIKKTRIFLKKKLTRHVSQRSVFNPELSAFLKIPQNRNTSLTTRKDWTNFCLFIAHYLSSEGGHFDTNFDRKIARLRWIKFDDRVHLRGLWKYPPIQIGADNEQY